MRRLLDEQSQSCSQLRVSVAETLSRSPGRSVATQCCLLSPEGRRRRTPESHFLDQTPPNGSSQVRLRVWQTEIIDCEGRSPVL